MSEPQLLTRGDCILDEYHVPQDHGPVAAITEEQPQAQPPLPREVQRQIAAYLAKQVAKPRPMQTKIIGRNATPVIVASDGSMYAQPVKGGAYVRVAVDHATGEAVRIVPWSKARRRAEKRKRQASRQLRTA